MLDLIAFIFTVTIFGIIGYNLSNKFAKPITTLRIIVFVILSLFLFNVGNGTRLISIMGFDIMANRVLGSLSFGYTLGIILQMLREKKVALTK